MGERVYNFSSGPAMLPAEVLRDAAGEMLDWGGRGYSVMETSHRSPEFVAVLEQTEALLREFAAARNLVQLKGHRSVGGMRASIYNPMPVAGVASLVDFMRNFERRHG